MKPDGNTSSEFFELRYQRNPDPWNFVGSEYEHRRFESIRAALTHRRYRHILEPGCSIGTLTVRLATLCDRLTAFDFSSTAVEHARSRCAGLQHIEFAVAALSEDTDVAPYDLVILSEIGYYFQPERWRSLVATLADAMQPGTTVLASHWLGQSPEHVQEGDLVHEALRAEPKLELEYEERHEGFRLDRFTRV